MMDPKSDIMPQNNVILEISNNEENHEANSERLTKEIVQGGCDLKDAFNHNLEAENVGMDTNHNISSEEISSGVHEDNSDAATDYNEKVPSVEEHSERNEKAAIDNETKNDGIPSETFERLSTSPEKEKEDFPENIYHIKWVQYNQTKCGIITQNSNGPCPLLAIVNILILKGKLSMPQGCEVISAEQLLEYLADLIISLRPDNQNSLPDFQHNMNDAIAILPKLQTGLDVNVKFTGVSDFEYTPECIIFDLLNIALYHGWLIDPQMEDTLLAVNNLSYNQLVETIISNKSSDDSSKVSQSLIAQQFLEESASQLTYHGLYELNSVMKEDQLAVFFRNNHFSTMCKQGSNLYLLVTDQGFLQQPEVVWETLENIEGDTVFVDHLMNPLQSSSTGGSPDQDHLLAMSLQKQDEAQYLKEKEWENFKENLGDTKDLTDAELAARLQEAENAAGRSQESRQAIGPRSNRDKKCTIL